MYWKTGLNNYELHNILKNNNNNIHIIFLICICTWKFGLGLGYGSQAEREFSWYLKGPLNAWVMALKLKTQTAEAAMLFLWKKYKY